MTAIDCLATQSSGHCTIGRNQRRVRSEAHAFQQRRSIGHAASGGDCQGYSRVLGGFERRNCARADLPGKARQQGSVHVDCYQAKGRMHRFSLPGETMPV